MAQFTANRLSSGNRLFPDQVTIDEAGITLKVPSLFSGKAKTLTYHDVYAVSTNNPLVGFSTIEFRTRNYDHIVASGFTKDDAEEIKRLAHIGINAARSGNTNTLTSAFAQNDVEQAKIALEKQSHEDEINLQRKQLDLEETRSRRERADQLRGQGRSTQAFFVEHGIAVSIGAFLLVVAIFVLSMMLKNNNDDKLDAELTRKEDHIQTLITEGKKDEAISLIDELQHDSQQQSKHKKSFMEFYSYMDYWKNERETLRQKITGSHHTEKTNKTASTPTTTSPNTTDETSGLHHYGEEDVAEKSLPGRYPQASARLLDQSDLNGLTKDQLKIMRNEIMARHGYIFTGQALKDYFAKQSWYQPTTNDVGNILSELEKNNIALIKQAEK